jgi:leader peptidase (prepilin peptidase)/N-methyltransferase
VQPEARLSCAFPELMSTNRGTRRCFVGAAGRKRDARGKSSVVDPAAGIVGLLAGAAVGPLADRIAINAPIKEPLLARTSFTRRSALVTVATALFGACVGLAFGFTLEALVGAVFCWILTVITRTDLEHHLIPNRIVLPGAILVVASRTIDDPSVEWLLAALGAGLALFLVVLAYPKGMGMGDVKLALLLGGGLGIAVTVALFLGFLAAFFPAAALIVRHGRSARKRAIPLGPFLALGGVIALFAGDEILDWYVGFGS